MSSVPAVAKSFSLVRPQLNSGKQNIPFQKKDDLDEFLRNPQERNGYYSSRRKLGRDILGVAGVMAIVFAPLIGLITDVSMKAKGGYFATGIAVGLLSFFGMQTYINNDKYALNYRA